MMRMSKLQSLTLIDVCVSVAVPLPFADGHTFGTSRACVVMPTGTITLSGVSRGSVSAVDVVPLTSVVEIVALIFPRRA